VLLENNVKTKREVLISDAF